MHLELGQDTKSWDGKPRFGTVYQKLGQDTKTWDGEPRIWDGIPRVETEYQDQSYWA